jgi:hypothetical protein
MALEHYDSFFRAYPERLAEETARSIENARAAFAVACRGEIVASREVSAQRQARGVEHLWGRCDGRARWRSAETTGSSSVRYRAEPHKCKPTHCLRIVRSGSPWVSSGETPSLAGPSAARSGGRRISHHRLDRSRRPSALNPSALKRMRVRAARAKLALGAATSAAGTISTPETRSAWHMQASAKRRTPRGHHVHPPVDEIAVGQARTRVQKCCGALFRRGRRSDVWLLDSRDGLPLG